MSTERNIQTVKDFFAAIGRRDQKVLFALVADDIEWIIPGDHWPLAGTRHGPAGVADLLETASKSVETSTEIREFVAHGRVTHIREYIDTQALAQASQRDAVRPA